MPTCKSMHVSCACQGGTQPNEHDLQGCPRPLRLTHKANAVPGAASAMLCAARRGAAKAPRPHLRGSQTTSSVPALSSANKRSSCMG
jgi:hypothetical protein